MIAGYIIVRKILYNENATGDALLKPAHKVHYQGIDRSMWNDIDASYFSGALPDDLKPRYSDLCASGNDLTFTKVLKKLEHADDFLNINKDSLLKNEVIAVSSPILNKVKGEFQEFSVSIHWLGYDIVQLGGWSLIRQGIFENQQYTLLGNQQLNEFGLFDDLTDIDLFLAEYDRLSKIDMVDVLLEGINIDYIKVGRPKNQQLNMLLKET